MKKLIFLHMILLISFSTAYAGESWQCVATDKSHKSWKAESGYLKKSLYKAQQECKKQSKYPRTCIAHRESCNVIIIGRATKDMWHCQAMDRDAKKWVSTIYRDKYDAAMAARRYCEKHSSAPHSCYVNLLACENLNENK